MVRRCIAMCLVASCAPNVLPPPAVPAQVMPPIAAVVGPPLAGSGQVAIVVDEPSVVEEVTGHMEGFTAGGHFVSGLNYQTVCPQTPCVANLALGSHALRITSSTDPNHSGTGSITVGPQPTDYRYAVGHNIDPQFGGGLAAITVGVMGLVVGPVFIGIGDASPTGPNFTSTGYIALIGGVVLTALGAVLMSNGRGSTQDGTGVQWTPSGPP